MARISTISCAPTAVDRDGVCQAQTTAGAAALTLNGALVSAGVATFGAAQIVTGYSAGNIAGVTFTITGTDAQGTVITDTITGINNGTVSSTKYFKTVTGVSASGSTSGVSVEIGNAITAVSETLIPSLKENPFNIGLGCIATGTVTYTVQHAIENPGTAYSSLTWFDHSSVAAKTASADGNYAFPVSAIRIRVTASTSGSVSGTFVQAGA